MSTSADHLPECDYSDNDLEFPESWTINCCICDRLRACEQRVRDEHSEPDAYRGWVTGYAAALAAAREAVAGLRTYGDHGEVIPPDEEAAVIYMTDALAAIDALRGEKS